VRTNIKDFVGLCAHHLNLLNPIYEFGSFQVPSQVGFADLRPFFPARDYVGCDIRPGPGVDRIEDIHDIKVSSASVGTVLCMDTLEHVEHPHVAVQEMCRILKPGGICLISSHMWIPIHNCPNDFWRFTPDAFSLLLRCFESSYVSWAGRENFPHTVVGIGFKYKPVVLSDDFDLSLKRWKRKQGKYWLPWVRI